MADIRVDPSEWKYGSPDTVGLHAVVTPRNSACKVTSIFRLNLAAGDVHHLQMDALELSAAVISGGITLRAAGEEHTLAPRDSFYLPGGMAVDITATADTVIFIGGGPWEGEGAFFVRKLDLATPLGDVHQVHGKPPYEREVWMCVNQEMPASRLITGLTWGHEGMWTSWPPHQHSRDLEEVYCYFDIPAPKFALHLSSRRPGCVEAVHPVSTGDCVVVPEGYHPTVGSPGVRSCYFWVMVAHSRASRRYDLAVNDPNFG